jgi:3-oxoacyl-[acyl-carrier protein] reductase
MTEPRVVAITGGGRRLGRALALTFAQSGYDIGILGRSPDELERVKLEIDELGRRCEWRQCDVSQWEQVSHCLPDLAQTLGRLDVLINNAGGWRGATLEDADPQEFRSLLEGSVLGAAYCSKAVLPVMRAQGGGFILNIGSTSGLDSSRDVAISSTPKGAIRSFARALALEVQEAGIRVAVLHPASIEKELPYDEIPLPNSDGLHVRVSQRQVADIAVFVVEQPPNVNIRELVVTPSGVFW